MLEKPAGYNEVQAQQGEATVYAEDINQIISNVENIKGGEANEAPISNIKDLHSSINELKEKLDGVGTASSADKIAFNNDNANLDFSSQYDFPPFKNILKDQYLINLITDYAIDDVSHIDDIKEIYTLTLEKKEDYYVLKGQLKYNNTTPNSSQLNFYIKNIDDNNDWGYIISEIYQFIYKENNAVDNDIIIDSINNLKYYFGFFYAVPIFQIKKQDDSNFEVKEYDINLDIEIPINNIQNNQEFIPIACGNTSPSFLKIENVNSKVLIKGEVIQEVSGNGFILFSHFALENYFDLKLEENESYYINAGTSITSNKNKPIKYYIRKEIIDASDLSPIYANVPITWYYLEIKHTDNSSIEFEEKLTFNLIAPKNSEIPKIQKEKNVQNAIEILNNNIYTIMSYLGLNDYHFEIADSILVNPVTDNKIKDCSNLVLVKNIDNSFTLKGSIELYEDTTESSAMLIKTKETISSQYIRNIIPALMNTNLLIITIIIDNYLFFQIVKTNETPITNVNLDNIKVIDNKIVLFNNEIINSLSPTKVSEDFGIYYEDSKYKIKGQLIFDSSENTFSFYTNIGIADFFEDQKIYTINTNEGELKAQYSFNYGFMSSLMFEGVAGTSYNIDWVLPKQI